MRRVLFLNNQGLGSIGGGVTILRHLVADFAQDSAVTVMSFDEPAPAPPEVRQIALPRPPAAGTLWRAAPLLRARHLARTAPSEAIAEADLVIALDCHFAPLLARTPPRRLIYLSLSCIPRQEWFGNSGIQAGLSFAQYAWLEYRIGYLADDIVASSHMHARELRRFAALWPRAPRVIYPVFEAGPALPARRQDPPMILSLGRLEHVKRFDFVIAMAERLRRTQCRFVIAGAGQLEDALRARARAVGVADRIEFAGPRMDVRPLLAEASLLLHPSCYESFGIAVFEAMCAGVPPVFLADAVAGFREITHDGVDACALDPSSLDAAATALGALLADPARRAAMGEAAKSTAARLLASSYTAEFRKLAGPGGRQPS